MNRLKYSRCYLVGPMDFDRDGGKIWRDELEEYLDSLGVISLNPYTKPLHYSHGPEMLEDDVGAANRRLWQESGQFDKVASSMKLARAVDLRMVDHADFIIAYLNFNTIMTGTIEELVTANREKKPVIILSSRPKETMPPWYFAMFPHQLFFTTVSEVKEYIRHINEDEVVDTLNRWVFFDLEPRIKEIYESPTRN
jgi:nucleoside 2-deoxyribosyltransferase